MDAGDGGARRKRKSRFSDPVADAERPLKKRSPTEIVAAAAAALASVAAMRQPPLAPATAGIDPTVLAKAAAAKIASVLPHGAAAAPSVVPGALGVGHATAVDAAEQRRLEEEKRLRTEKIYKSVQDQMSRIRAVLRKPGEASSKETFMPAPLLLDDQGRQIDEAGNVIADKPTVSARRGTGGRGGSKASAPVANQNPYLSHRNVDKEDKLEVVDPRLKVSKRETRAAKTFNFVKEGTYVKQAEQVRAREAKKMLAGFTSGRNPRGYQKEAIVAIDDDDAVAEASVGSSKTEVEAMEIHDIEVPPRPASLTPDVEWWDIEFLPKDQRAMVDKFGFVKAKVRAENAAATVSYADMKLKFSSTFHVVEHPARLSVIVKKDDQPVALPLMLTAAERKKIRRQNRAEREKEKQDKITLGLLPPPEPKVKLSNMMRVLSEQAVADPSAIERKVREQVAQREKNHEMRNLARKLTPEERREKKLRKIKEDAAGDIHVAVFKVPDLTNPQHRFKVDVNAQQYHLTGGVLICKDDNLSMVVVEGGRKAIKHYSKLMLRRIDWLGDKAGNDEDDSEDESAGAAAASKSNGCTLVWQGVVARKAFNSFRFQECRTATTARKVMEAKHVVHYWDLVEKSGE